MANELRHEDTATGTTLKRTDWEDVDSHRFDSQATGDMVIATSATQLSRLAITDNRILVSSGGLFSWSNTLPAFTAGGGIVLGSDVLINLGVNTNRLVIQGGDANAPSVQLWGQTSGAPHLIALGNADNVGAATTRLNISGGLATAVATWSSITHTGLVLSGALTLNGQAFDAGAGDALINTTGAAKGLSITSTNDGPDGVGLTTYHLSATPADGDYLCGHLVYGEDDASLKVIYGATYFRIEDVQAGSNAGKMEINLRHAAGLNTALSLSGAGALWVDADIDFSTSIDSGAVANHASLGCFDIGGQMTLALSQENVVVVEVDETKFSHKMPIRINGATYYMMLTAT